MKSNVIFKGILSSLLFSSVTAFAQDENITLLLHKDTTAAIRRVVQHPYKFRVQVVYTQVRKDSIGKLVFVASDFRINDDEYFYPATLVKLPIAALALEKINSLHTNGLSKDSYLKVLVPYISKKEKPVTIRENIIRMLVLNDKNAFNRLYEFLGQEYINSRLEQLGYEKTRIIQRFNSASTEENRTTGPYEITDSLGKTLYKGMKVTCRKKFTNPIKETKIGTGYIEGKKFVRVAKDFQNSNNFPLSEAHRMLISVIYPEETAVENRFNISAEDFEFLKTALGYFPKEAGILEWMNDEKIYDTQEKFLFAGASKDSLPHGLRIYNKAGFDYGFIADCAYIQDKEKDVEFFVSAVLYTNSKDILSEEGYEYKENGYPFLKELGKLIYYHEIRIKDITVK
ncbi:MAG: serine hydrolase [Sporocytophaga sp.]|uniref:serine hydrolase n=1 Tax=Sporocytophaga sp. TaxID=2231183 RepID=UPI001B0E2372|nr:serine hydrolase [Sporocytophaga sp.]MBO9698915.1 serine hydrolase [Sporocytophaga sp.]